jgi:hypothetical protein
MNPLYKVRKKDSPIANEMRNIIVALENVVVQCGKERHFNLREDCKTWLCYYIAELDTERNRKRKK